LRGAIGRANRRRWRNLRRIFAHHLAHAPAAGNAPLRNASAMIDRAWMRRVTNIVWAIVRNSRRHLRTVATDKLARKIVREIDPRRHRYRAVGVGAVANDLSAIGQNAGAGEPLAQSRRWMSSRMTKSSVVSRARWAAGLLCLGGATVALLTM